MPFILWVSYGYPMGILWYDQDKNTIPSFFPSVFYMKICVYGYFFVILRAKLIHCT